MWIYQGTSSNTLNILKDAILQKFTFASGGQADHIGMEFSYLQADFKF
jgi:hypothetical protein